MTTFTGTEGFGIIDPSIPPIDNQFDVNQTTGLIDTTARQSIQDRSLDMLAFSVPGTIVGLADTIGQSVGLLDENEMVDIVRNAGRFGQVYEQNRDAFRATGDFVGFWIPGGAAVKAINGANWVGRALGGSRIARSILTSGKTVSQLTARVRRIDQILGRRGVMNFELNPERVQAAAAALRVGTIDAVKRAAAFEAGTYAFMNESEVLYPDDFTVVDYLIYGAALPGAGVFIERAMLNAALRRSVRSVRNRSWDTRQPVREGLRGEFLYTPTTREGLGGRDAGIVDLAIQNRTLRHQVDDSIDRAGQATVQVGPFTPGRLDNVNAGSLQNQIEINNSIIRQQVKSLGIDNPLPRITTKHIITDGESRTLRLANENFPDTMLGTISIDDLPTTNIGFRNLRQPIERRLSAIDKQIGKIQERIDNLAAADVDEYARLTDEVTSLQKEQEFIGGLEYHVIEPDGTQVLAAERKPTIWDRPEIKPENARVKIGEPTTFVMRSKSPRFASSSMGVSVTEDLSITIGNKILPEDNIIFGIDVGAKMPKNPNRARFSTLDGYERSMVYRTLRRAMDHFKLDARNAPQIVVNINDHHVKLDALDYLVNKHGMEPLIKSGRLKLPSAWRQDINVMRFASLESKFQDYLEIAGLRDGMNAAKGSAKRINAPDALKPNLEDMRKGLNLPGSGGLMASATVQTFEHLYQQGYKSLYDIIDSLETFQAYAKSIADFPRISRPGSHTITKTVGDNFNIDPRNNPVLLTKRSLETTDYTFPALQTSSINNQILRDEIMDQAPQNGAELVALISNEIRKSTASASARKIDLLVQGANQGRGNVVQQNFATRQIEPFEAMNLLEDTTTRQGREWISNLYQTPRRDYGNRSFNDIWARLRGRNQRADMFSFNTYEQSRRYGWELEDIAENVGDKFAFRLKTEGADGARNRQRFEKIFGRAWDPEAEKFMPMVVTERDRAVYKPLQITSLAHDAARSIAELGQVSLANSNHLKRVLGRRVTAAKNWWIPPRNLSRGEIRYIVTPGEELKTVIWGQTKREVEDLVQQVTAQPEFRRSIAITPDQMRMHLELQDRQFFELLDYSDPIFQTSNIRGKTAIPLLAEGEEVLNGMVTGVNQQLENTIRRTRAAMFETELNYAKKMSEAIAANEPGNIWSQYINTVYGQARLDPRTTVGKIYTGLEGAYDDMLNYVHDQLILKNPETNQSISDSMRTLMRGQEKEYSYLAGKLGAEHMPFRDATEFIEKTYRLSPPPNAKIHAAKLNQFTSLLTLRLLEAGHAILNLTSLAAVTPAVARGMNRFKGESVQEWRTRINAFGVLRGVKGGEVPEFSGIRSTISGVHYAFAKENRGIWDDAAKRGFFNQEVAELMKTLTHPSEGYAANLISKYGSALTYLSDKSEYLSRAIGFMTGHRMATQVLKMSNKEDALLFAHNFANKVIGDYRPNNRPRIFQGALGMPLGLFQTFTWNYYQRLFSYIENADVRTAATQFAMQSSVFGVQSVPGWDLVTEFFASNYDGTTNPVDGFQNVFGADWKTDTILYGTLSNIPRIFGAETGVALYSRGDLNIQRLPGLWSIDKTAPAQLIQNAYNILDQSVGMMRQQGFSSQQMAEILATNSISRPLRNIIEVSLGERVDPRGQLIRNDIRSGLSIAARTLGLRTLLEAKQDEAYFRLRSTQFSQMEKMRELRTATRAAIREDGTIDDQAIRSAIHNYIRYGGSPNYFGQWLRDQYIAAKVPRAERALIESLRDGNRLYDVQRLMNSGVLSPGEE